MTRRDFLCSVSSVPVLTSLTSEMERGAAQGTHRLDSDKHLFLDDFLIAEKTNVTLTVNPPQRRELVIVADKLWERNGITSYCNVFYDENKSYAVASTAFNPTPLPSPHAGRGENPFLCAQLRNSCSDSREFLMRR